MFTMGTPTWVMVDGETICVVHAWERYTRSIHSLLWIVGMEVEGEKEVGEGERDASGGSEHKDMEARVRALRRLVTPPHFLTEDGHDVRQEYFKPRPPPRWDKIAWTTTDTAHLMKGIVEFGVGNWEPIMDKFELEVWRVEDLIYETQVLLGCKDLSRYLGWRPTRALEGVEQCETVADFFVLEREKNARVAAAEDRWIGEMMVNHPGDDPARCPHPGPRPKWFDNPDLMWDEEDKPQVVGDGEEGLEDEAALVDEYGRPLLGQAASLDGSSVLLPQLGQSTLGNSATVLSQQQALPHGRRWPTGERHVE